MRWGFRDVRTLSLRVPLFGVALLGATLAMVALSAAPTDAFTTNAYVASSGGFAIAQLDVAGNGALAFGGTEFAFNEKEYPAAIALSPDGKSAYVADSQLSGLVEEYDVGSDGTLTHKATPAIAAGKRTQGIAVSPDGKNVYATNHEDGTISQYDVGAGGSLSAQSPATVGAAPEVIGIAVSPNNQDVYAVAPGKISQFAIGAGGKLAPLAAGPVTTGTGAEDIAISPDGQAVYVTGYKTNQVYQYAVGAGGALKPMSPASVTADVYGSAIAVSPDGRSVYVTGQDYGGKAPGPGSVWQASVGASDALSAKTPASVPVSGEYPQGIVVNPDGRDVYVTSQRASSASKSPGSVSELSVGAGGLLSESAMLTLGLENAGAIALVPDQGPVAAFQASPATAGSLSSFDGSHSSDATGAVASYTWSFGDGTTLAGGGPTPTHVYASAGTYTVTLTTADDAACSTALVFTGQTAHCNADPAASVSQVVTIAPAPRAPSTTTTTPPVHPSLSGLRLTPATFALRGRRSGRRCVAETHANRRRPRCTRPLAVRIAYTLSEAAQVTIKLQRSLAGRLVRGRCTSPSRANRKRRVCTRLLAVAGSVVVSGRPGANTFALAGRFAGHALAPGSYELTAVPRSGASAGTAVQVRLRVAR